jgi:imidazolonepropionase-like amidohydrolase
MNDHHTFCMTFDEMQEVVTTAHNHALKVTGYCRATEGIKVALLAGFDSIEHGSLMDDETMDVLLARDVPVVPALFFETASVIHGAKYGMSQQVIDGHQETLDAGTMSAQRIIHERGRLDLGGDYGFAWIPHGD